MNTPMVYVLKAEHESERPAHAFWAEYLGVYTDYAGDAWFVVRRSERGMRIDLIDPSRVAFAEVPATPIQYS